MMFFPKTSMVLQVVALAACCLAFAPVANSITFVRVDSQPIPPDGSTGGSGTPPTISELVVGDNFTICDLNLFVNITHTWTEDLRVTLRLITPGGDTFSAKVADDECYDGDNLIETFDDEAEETHDVDDDRPVCVDGGDPVRPQEPLSVFNGQNVGGTWQLEIFDDFLEETGRLNEWAIIVRDCHTLPPAAPTNANPTTAAPTAAPTTASPTGSPTMPATYYTIDNLHTGLRLYGATSPEIYSVATGRLDTWAILPLSNGLYEMVSQNDGKIMGCNEYDAVYALPRTWLQYYPANWLQWNLDIVDCPPPHSPPATCVHLVCAAFDTKALADGVLAWGTGTLYTILRDKSSNPNQIWIIEPWM